MYNLYEFILGNKVYGFIKPFTQKKVNNIKYQLVN